LLERVPIRSPGVGIELLEHMAVMKFQVLAVSLKEALPAELRRDDGRTIVRRSCALVSHLEEEEEDDLLGVER
jgi:hypothetical protein